MREFARGIAAFLFALILFLGLAWVAGCNFDGTWDDPIQWDHPENYLQQTQK